jgi:glycosyltransferase involved in cell wall biosynthesis
VRALIVNSILWGGGVDSQTLTLAQALLARGAEVVLAAPAQARMIAEAHRIPGLTVAGLDRSRAAWPLALRGLIRRHRIDIVHAHHGRDYWISILANALAGSPARVVVTRHLMTPLGRGTQRWIGDFATMVAVSDAVQRALRSRRDGQRLRIRRLHCGIDTRRFAPSEQARQTVRAELALPPQAFLFALVGNVHAPEGKGHFVFAEAAARVAQRHAEAYFLCIGGGELRPKLEERVAALGLSAKFRFVPFCQDLERRLAAIDALVHPAVGSEALGLVILEALSCAKPVVASWLDGIPETMIDGKHGYLVEPRDVAELAARMSELAADRQSAAQMGACGRQWIIDRFSIERLGTETLALYRELVEGTAVPGSR